MSPPPPPPPPPPEAAALAADPGFQGPVTYACMLSFLAVAVTVMGVELVVLERYFRAHAISITQLALIHVGILAALGLLLVTLKRDLVFTNMVLFLTISTALIGPGGAAGAILVAILFLLYRRNATPFDEWYAAIFPEDEDNEVRELAHKLRAQGDVGGEGVSPFRDVVAFGGPREKQAVIAMISRNFHPAFSSVLKDAFRDSNNAVRVQAASAITRIEDQFVEKAMEFDAAVRENPNNHALMRKRAYHYDEYAFTGLLDRDRERENQEKALTAYRGCLEMDPDNERVRLAVARILIRNGKIDEAAEFLEASMARGLESPPLLLWYFECLYRQKRFRELNDFTKKYEGQFGKNSPFPSHVAETVGLWAG